MNTRHLLLFLLLAAMLVATSCFRRDFERPPDTSGYDPHLPVTHSIAQLKALNGLYSPVTGGDTTLITGDVLISGIVVADDRSGNFYKQLVIQDSSAGLFVNINAYSLYTQYPVGRRLYIQCKGLYLGYNGGTMELGSSVTEQLQLTGLSGGEIGAHIIKGAVGNIVQDTLVTLAQVKSISASSASRFLVGRLITIQDVQFADTNVTYTDPAQTTNRTITDCVGSSATLAVRSSNYADFHAVPVARGRGSLRGIYTVYQSSTFTPQLLIRDTADARMYGARCGVLPLTPFLSIDSLRKMYPGTGIFTLPPLRFSGTVISDLTKGNVSAGNFILEDGSKKGIILYISTGSYRLCDSLLIDGSGGKLQLYNGAMELTGISSSKVSKPATGKTVVPIQLTIAKLNAAFAEYESVLVRVVNAGISGGGTYSGNKTLSDGTGTISLYTAPGATFSGMNVPTTPKTFTGIATLYTPNEIKLRDPAIDVY